MYEQLVIMLQLLGTATLVAIFARRLHVPYSTALVVTGLLLSYFRLLPDVRLNSEIVINLFLPVLLFQAAINTDATRLRENLKPVFLLSTLGMAVMAGVTGTLLHLFLGLAWPVALLLGAMFSITDTVTVLAVFKDLKVPARLSTMVEGEGLLNNGMALVFFRVLLVIVLTGIFDPVRSALELVTVTVGGLLVGGLLGLLTSWGMQQTRDHLAEIMLTTLVALGSFFIAEQFGVSGVIAVVTAGLIVGNFGWRRVLQPRSQIALGSFWEYAGFGVNSAVFLLVGLNLNFVELGSYIPAIVIAYAALQAGRFCAIYPGFFLLGRFERHQVPVKWLHVMQWGSLKGSLTMALAISLPLALPQRTELITIAFGVVLLSLLVQGLSLGPLVRSLGLAGGPPLRQLFEREQLKVIAARAAQAEIRSLHESGILSSSAYERLRARYQVSIAQAEREIRVLGTEFQAHWDEVLAEIRQRLKQVEKGAVRDAMRQRLISEEAAKACMKALDDEPGPTDAKP
ncbi:MAG: Na+/H+ antiporter [Candidatus Sericytochromatia bacterium]